MSEELRRGKQRCRSYEVTSQLMSESLCGFFPWIFFPSKTNPPKYMEITSCELFQIQSLGLACVSWLRSSKAFLDRVLLPLKIPLTSLKDSFYKHIKKIKSSAKIYALQLGCEGQQQTQIDHDKYLKIMCLARYCYSKYTRNPNNSIAKKKKKKLNFYKHPKDQNAHFLKEEIQMTNRYVAMIPSISGHQI